MEEKIECDKCGNTMQLCAIALDGTRYYYHEQTKDGCNKSKKISPKITKCKACNGTGHIISG